MTDLHSRAGELHDELEAHPYAQISHRLDEIRVVLDALEQNYELLSEFVEEWLQDEEIHSSAPYSQKMEIRRELFRRLHNYLASYHTQYEFTKSFRDSTIGKDSEAYQELMAEHNIRPTSDFLKGCRNYMQKRLFLNVTTSFRWPEDSGDTTIQTYLSAEEFKSLHSSLRSDKAIDFVENYEDDRIPFLEVIEGHHPDLLAFHEDFRDQIRDEYSSQLEEYMELQSEQNEILSELWDTE